MSSRLCDKIILGIAGLLFCGLVPVHASTDATTMRLTASPTVIVADGKSTTTITANVGDVPDGTQVLLSTTLGALSSNAVATAAGVARVTLTSASNPGTAEVTAVYNTGGSGLGSGKTRVQFTEDAEL